MPIYEYRCANCGHQLEKLQRMNDEPLKDCPACGKAGLRRLVSAAGFRLKGAGWYETDFKQGNRRNLVEGDKPGTETGSAAKSQGKPESKSAGDAKPAATPDTKPAAKPVDAAQSQPASTPSASA